VSGHGLVLAVPPAIAVLVLAAFDPVLGALLFSLTAF
jgi:hypothetical protein